jgi:hypothetical protein
VFLAYALRTSIAGTDMCDHEQQEHSAQVLVPVSTTSYSVCFVWLSHVMFFSSCGTAFPAKMQHKILPSLLCSCQKA